MTAPTVQPVPRHDARADRFALLAGTALIMTVLTVLTSALTTYVYAKLLGPGAGPTFGHRMGANVIAVAAFILALAALRLERARRWWQLALGIVTAALVAAVGRTLGQALFGVYTAHTADQVTTDFLVVVVIASVAGGVGATYMASRRVLRSQLRRAVDAQLQVELALRELQREEVRVRREVAEGLHGSLQQRLVLIVARLDRILEHVDTGSTTPADADALREIRDAIEAVREGDVRETSRLLYPDGLEIGLVPALRAMTGRLPASIGTQLRVADAVRALDDPTAPQLTEAERLLAVRVAEEGVTNALRHGGATAIAIDVDLDGRDLLLSVRDDGTGFDTEATTPSGTLRLADRLRLIGGTVTVTSAPGQGTTIASRIPLECTRSVTLPQQSPARVSAPAARPA
jgi:two-component system sensor histidine kinase UhpB